MYGVGKYGSWIPNNCRIIEFGGHAVVDTVYFTVSGYSEW